MRMKWFVSGICCGLTMALTCHLWDAGSKADAVLGLLFIALVPFLLYMYEDGPEE